MKKYISIITLLFITVVLLSCKKQPQIPSGSNRIESGQTNIDTISYINAIVSSSIDDIIDNTIIDYGHCWNANENPSLVDNHTSFGKLDTLGKYISIIESLQSNTIYYVRSYLNNGNTIIYGEASNFKTLKTGIPVLSTYDVTEITTSFAKSGGNVTIDSGFVITARGVCWDTVQNFSLSDCLGNTQDGNGLGNFVSNITELLEGQDYYIKAYASNSNGTGYGNTQQFSTIPITLPSVTTHDVTDITISAAICGGEVLDSGNGNVNQRGIVWSKNQNPTIENNIGLTVDGEGLGIFESIIEGLEARTDYYLRAYATNEKGTAYGSVLNFTTDDPPWQCGDLLNYNGQEYSTIIIGEQCWIGENLNVGIRINGNQFMSNNQVTEKYCYNNDETNCEIYGGLYQWNEMMQYITIEGSQGICPDGWHIPTDNEWSELVDFIGSPSNAGGKMKEEGFEHWNEPNTGATNLSGFTALPGGGNEPNGLSFYYIGTRAHFMSSTLSTPSTSSWTRILDYTNSDIGRYNYSNLSSGYSVRCVKD